MKKRFLFACTIALAALLALSLFSCQKDDAENNSTDGFVMTAKIIAINDKIEVEVIEEINGMTGKFWVNTSPTTAILDKNGNPLLSLEVGQIVEITFDGKVMMSYPPQIAAQKIQVK